MIRSLEVTHGDVHRHTGGLEMSMAASLRPRGVHRHTGGLEMLAPDML